jgi:outer membrane PBP1 activator LpoA protein
MFIRKLTIGLLFILMAAMVLTACGGDSAEEDAVEEAADVAEETAQEAEEVVEEAADEAEVALRQTAEAVEEALIEELLSQLLGRNWLI